MSSNTSQPFQLDTNELNVASNTSNTFQNEFIFQEIQGDLFTDAPENSSLAHCVSADFKMSKGIAKIFKKNYGDIKELFNQHKKVGQVAILQKNNRYIFYIITK